MSGRAEGVITRGDQSFSGALFLSCAAVTFLVYFHCYGLQLQHEASTFSSHHQRYWRVLPGYWATNFEPLKKTSALKVALIISVTLTHGARSSTHSV